MIFIHGWPEIGLIWRAQMEAFAALGWRCVAPDMRGYGKSSAPSETSAYCLSEIVQDMIELHDYLGGLPAIWIGHDWGSPVTGLIASHHKERTRGIVLIALPYFPGTFTLPSLIPLIDRRLYPAATYPYGQWDYFRYYQTNFDSTVADLDADIPASLASIYRSGNPALFGTFSPSASTTANGGRYGAAHRAPATEPDAALWPRADFEVLVASFRLTGFRSANAWYLNDEANLAFARSAPEGGGLTQPVLFVNSDDDLIAGITGNMLGEPMRAACSKLTIANVAAGHWSPLEGKIQLVESIQSWLMAFR